MPIYEYICLNCNETFSLLQSMSLSENKTACPKCSSKDVKKLISSFSCKAGSGNASYSMPSPGFGGGGG